MSVTVELLSLDSPSGGDSDERDFYLGSQIEGPGTQKLTSRYPSSVSVPSPHGSSPIDRIKCLGEIMKFHVVKILKL